VNRQLASIYKTPSRVKDFKVGFKYAMKCAAEFINTWDGQTSRYRLGDVLLCKFNMRKTPPRRSRKKVVK
jgi:hypothetical protein